MSRLRWQRINADMAISEGGTVAKLRATDECVKPLTIEIDSEYYWWGNTVEEGRADLDRITGTTWPPKPEPEQDQDDRWTEGICGDGAVFLYDGVMVPIENVVASLNASLPTSLTAGRWSDSEREQYHYLMVS